jgi:hypothetical protein
VAAVSEGGGDADATGDGVDGIEADGVDPPGAAQPATSRTTEAAPTSVARKADTA